MLAATVRTARCARPYPPYLKYYPLVDLSKREPQKASLAAAASPQSSLLILQQNHVHARLTILISWVLLL